MSAASSSDAAQRLVRGATKPSDGGARNAWKTQYALAGLKIASLNVGINQQMFGERAWVTHGTQLGKVVREFFEVVKSDLAFFSELGDYRQGASHHLVDTMLETSVGNASSAKKGAMCSIYNVGNNDATLVHEGVRATSLDKQADMHWQAFLVDRRTLPGVGGASQPADDDSTDLEDDGGAGGAAQPSGAACKIGLIVGNVHINVGSHSKPTVPQKKAS